MIIKRSIQTLVTGLLLIASSALGASINDCKGDGVADDSVCLSGLMAAAAKVNGTLTLIKGKNYLISQTLTLPANLKLNGNGASVTAGKIPSSSAVLKINGSNVLLQNLTIVSKNSAKFSSGILIAGGAKKVKLQSNVLKGFFGNAIYFGAKGQSDIVIDGNKIDAGTDRTKASITYGILLNSLNIGSRLEDYPKNITISNNTVLNVNADAIEINAPVFGMAPNGSGKEGLSANSIVIKGNTLSAPFAGSTGAGLCIGVAGAFNVQITGNKMSKCKFQGIHLEDESYNVTISNNVVSGVIGVPGAIYSSCIYSQESHHVLIEKNTVSGCYNNGIYLAWKTTGMNESFKIQGNKITSNSSHHIRIMSDGKTKLNMLVGSNQGNRALDNTFFGANTEKMLICDASVTGTNVTYAKKRVDDVGGNGGICSHFF